jgi:NADH-quinone oxidoreductase subunit A
MTPTVLLPALHAAEAGAAAGLQPGDYIPFTIMVLLGLAVPGIILLLSWKLNKHRSDNPHKSEPYECGLRSTVGGADEKFSVKFYLIAMLFLVFDLEVAFLFPLALEFTKQEGWTLFGLLAVFLVMLEVGYLYLYRKGAFDWD